MPFASHLKSEKPIEGPTVAQKKKQYKNLLAKAYHHVYERSKKGFRGNAQTGSSLVPSRRSLNSYLTNEPADPQVSASAEVEDQCFVDWDDDGGNSSLQVKLIREWTHLTSVASMKFNANGRCLAIGHSEDQIGSQKTHIYDVTTGRKVCLLADRYAPQHLLSEIFLSFSPGDGKYLATGHSSGQATIWQVGERRVRNAFGAHQNWPRNTSADFSPDGRHVISSSSYSSRGVRIWSMRDGSSIVLRDRDEEEFGAELVKFVPDGKHVVASDPNGLLRLWSIRTSMLVRKWRAHEGRVLCVAFTPDGRGLVTGSSDHTLKYWDLGQPGFTEVEVLRFVGHTNVVRSVAISPDGQWVVSGSSDRTTRIWSTVDASLQYTLPAHEKWVHSVDFSPTGYYLASGSLDGKVSVWAYKSSGY